VSAKPHSASQKAVGKHAYVGVAREGMASQISKISFHFALWEV